MTTETKQSVLSVIIPTYNRASLLLECVGSLQTCGLTDLEIIVVDDGSTDNTAELFRDPLPSVTFLHQHNQGPASARNLGFAHSKGRYIAFLDSDDVWLPDVPRKVVELLDRHPMVDLLFCDARMGNAEEGYRSAIERFGQQSFFDLPHTRPEPSLRVLDRPSFFHRMLHRNAIFLGATVMRREAFERAGRFDPERFGTEDWELCLRIASRMTVAFWPEPLTVYEMHSQNLSANKDQMLRDAYLSLTNLPEKCQHLTHLEKHLIRRGCLDLLFGFAYAAYDRGDLSSARRRFGKLVRECPWHLSGLFYGLACCLPSALLLRLRKFKQSLASSEPSTGSSDFGSASTTTACP